MVKSGKYEEVDCMKKDCAILHGLQETQDSLEKKQKDFDRVQNKAEDIEKMFAEGNVPENIKADFIRENIKFERELSVVRNDKKIEAKKLFKSEIENKELKKMLDEKTKEITDIKADFEYDEDIQNKKDEIRTLEIKSSKETTKLNKLRNKSKKIEITMERNVKENDETIEEHNKLKEEIKQLNNDFSGLRMKKGKIESEIKKLTYTKENDLKNLKKNRKHFDRKLGSLDRLLKRIKLEKAEKFYKRIEMEVVNLDTGLKEQAEKDLDERKTRLVKLKELSGQINDIQNNKLEEEKQELPPAVDPNE